MNQKKTKYLILYNMKYKVLKGTPLFDKIVVVVEKIKDYNQQAEDLSNSVGGLRAATLGYNRAGGIAAFEFKKEPDMNLWKRVDKYEPLYSPRAKKANNALFAKIQALPITRYEEFNNVIEFKQHWSGLTFHQTYGLVISDDFMLIEMNDEVKYTPVQDMIEILGSEYNYLKESVKELS